MLLLRCSISFQVRPRLSSLFDRGHSRPVHGQPRLQIPARLAELVARLGEFLLPGEKAFARFEPSLGGHDGMIGHGHRFSWGWTDRLRRRRAQPAGRPRPAVRAVADRSRSISCSEAAKTSNWACQYLL